MKYKTLFRLMLKLMGVWIFVTGATQSLLYLTYLLEPQIWRTNSIWRFAVQTLMPLAQVAIGLYLFFGGKWILDKAIPSNRPYCHECGYDLTGAVGNICNECGTPFRAPAATQIHE